MLGMMRTIRHELFLRRIVIDSSILSVISGLTIGGVLYHNPAILHDDFPPAIRRRLL